MKRFKLTALEPTEAQLHATVAHYLDWVLMPPAQYTTFPAGWGVLTKSTAGRLKGAGLKQGMPDILLFLSGLCFGIELKSHKGTLTPVQRDMHKKLGAAGVPVSVCTSLEEVTEVLDAWGFRLRRTKGASDVKRKSA